MANLMGVVAARYRVAAVRTDTPRDTDRDVVHRRGPRRESEADHTIDSVARTLQVLEALTRTDTPLSLNELTSTLQCNRSTVYRLLWNLEKAGLVQRAGGSGYMLGIRVLDMASSYRAQNPLDRIATPVVDRVRDGTNETCCLMIRHGAERACLYVAESRLAVRWAMPVGTVGPLWRGSAGHVLYAHLTDSERKALAWDPETARAADNAAPTILAEGYSLTIQDTSPDVWSVAAPIRCQEGSVCAALAIAVPMQRMSASHLDLCKREVIAGAREISQRIGFSGTAPGLVSTW